MHISRVRTCAQTYDIFDQVGLGKIHLETVTDVSSEYWVRSLMIKPFFVPDDAWERIWFNALDALGK